MTQQIELCGGPCDGSHVIVPDDADQYLYMANNTTLNSIRPQEKPLPDVQIGYYMSPPGAQSLSVKWTKWVWTGYRPAS